MVYPVVAMQKTQKLYLQVADCRLVPETKTAELTVCQYVDASETTTVCIRSYVIRFEQDSWQYETIRTVS